MLASLECFKVEIYVSRGNIIVNSCIILKKVETNQTRIHGFDRAYTEYNSRKRQHRTFRQVSGHA